MDDELQNEKGRSMHQINLASNRNANDENNSNQSWGYELVRMFDEPRRRPLTRERSTSAIFSGSIWSRSFAGNRATNSLRSEFTEYLRRGGCAATSGSLVSPTSPSISLSLSPEESRDFTFRQDFRTRSKLKFQMESRRTYPPLFNNIRDFNIRK